MSRYCFQHVPGMRLYSVQSGHSQPAGVSHPVELVHCIILTDFTLCCESGRCCRPQGTDFVFAGGGLKSFAAGHLAYMLIRQFQLLIEDFSVNVELDQAVDSPAGEHGCSLLATVVHAMHPTDQANSKQDLKTTQTASNCMRTLLCLLCTHTHSPAIHACQVLMVTDM